MSAASPQLGRRFAVGIDVGGTFTDLTALEPDGRLCHAKTPSTPDNQARGVLEGLRKLAAGYGLSLRDFLAACEVIVHGTTVATNALLEYNGSVTGLLTTAGFRDELEFRRSYKESVFDVRLPAPTPIVPRRRRLGVPERVSGQGEVLQPLDEAAARQAVRELGRQGVEAVAICLLFSFLNPAHERRLAEIVAEELPGAFVSLSCEVLPQIREFERVSTTVVNAYVSPKLQRYLEALEAELREAGLRGPLYIMQSNGGVQSARETGRLGVNALLSGPAGGISAAGVVGELAGYRDLITVDMGGTSYDVGVVRDLRPTIGTEAWISRYRVATPMLDIHTIGAGGGSVAWLDSGGALRVGPRSAGAQPGPACYGRGGSEPTVTDADLVLGYLDPAYFLGGEMPLDVAAAEAAIARQVAEPLGISVVEAAEAIFRVVNHNMSNAIRYVCAKRGYDPRRFALLAMGGAGGVHAGPQAEDLGIRTIVVPSAAATFSALGDVLADLKVTEVRTFFTRMDALDLERLNRVFEEMEAVARRRLGEDGGWQGTDLARFIDLRYVGEVHEVTVPIASRTRRITELGVAATLHAFHEQHERLFAHKDPAQPVEALNLRLDLIGLRPRPRFVGEEFAGEDPSPALKGERSVHFRARGGFVPTPIYLGERLRPGNLIPGPAVIEHPGTTIVVYPGQEALIDRHGNCVIELRER